MMKKTAVAMVAIILIIMLFFGIAEKALSDSFGSTGTIILYTCAAVVLAVLYFRASSAARKEKEGSGDEYSDSEKNEKEFWPGISPEEASSLRETPYEGEIPEEVWNNKSEE